MRKFTGFFTITAALSAALFLASCAAPEASSPAGSSPGASAALASPSKPSAELTAELMAKLVPEGTRVLNQPAQPKTTLILFTDYQCPYCAKMDGLIQRVKSDYRDQVRIVVRNFPLPMHHNAPLAAQAVEAAAEQGALEKMASMVFSKQKEWAKAQAGVVETFTSYAQQLGLQQSKFSADLNSAAIKARVAKDLQDATELGLQGTPSLVLEGKLLSVDSSDYSSVKGPIDAVLAS
ncbi:DsbA family protein [Psychromicrobium lacuslunae]|uniref:DsbA family protein n=1 Tax=Psychromicrobium lacuslunae TaxID=1618207 RepID=UPI00069808A3|nr:thioredoxin domain-containing protein [Psychromicrobium lacuslunae]